jgi:hypothetical protein
MDDKVQERLDAAEAIAEALLHCAVELRRVPPDEGARQDWLAILANNLDHYISRSTQGWVR